jgi:hypothetical protein
MGTRIEKFKTHMKENKRAYISGGICFLAGVGATAVALCRKDGEVTVGDQDITQILSWRPEAHQHLEVWIEALGDPGNIIQDTTTGTIYASQGQAARELGLNRSRISQHLHGKNDEVEGHTFEKLGKAMVSG